MRRKLKWIVLACIAGLALSYAIYRKVNEVRLLVEWGLYAQQRRMSNYDPGVAARLMDSIFRGPRDNWHAETDRVLKRLLDEGHFVQKTASISTNHFNDFFFNMLDDEKENRLLGFTYSVYTNAPRREIVFIGPPDLVDKATARLDQIETVD